MKRKLAFILLLLAVGVLSLWMAGGMYRTSDDVDMRMILEGLSGARAGGPSPFCLYMNVLYGHVLCFFYRHFPSGYWYDVFNCSWLALSIAVIGWASCGASPRRNAVRLVLLAAVVAVLFACLQFSLTAAVLAIAGGVAGWRFVCGRGRLAWPWAVLALVLSLASSLIRFPMFLGASLVFGGTLLLAVRIRWRRALLRGVPLAVLLLASCFALKAAGDWIVAQNPTWRDLARLNAARSTLFDGTGTWRHMDRIWAGVEEFLPDAASGGGLTRADCRLLMSFFMIGRDQVFGAATLNDAVASVQRQAKPQDPSEILGRFWKMLRRECWMFAILLAVAAVCVRASPGRVAASWGFLAAVMLGTLWHFSKLPDRVWFGLAFAALVAWCQVRAPSSRLDGEGWRMRGVFLGLIGAALFASMTLVGRIWWYQRGAAIVSMDLSGAKMPATCRLVVDTDSDIGLLRAFRPFALGAHPTLFATPFAKFPDNRALARAWGIDGEDACEKICAPSSDVRLLLLTRGGNGFTCNICRALAYYLRVRHGQRMLVMTERVGRGVLLAKLRALDASEFAWWEGFRRQNRTPSDAEVPQYLARAKAYAEKAAYPGGSAPTLDERVWMLHSPSVDDDFTFGAVISR